MFLHLIGALFAMSLRPATTAAQPWSYTSTPTEYQNTVQYEVDDDAAFNTSTDPRVNLTMNCLAANGYGQWTMTTNVGSNANISGHDWNASPAGSFTNGQSGWFLLGNTLAKPAWNASSGAPDCQPPGVVSGGSFSGTLGSPKATANLNGAVRYVWPASDNLSFIVQGLSDIRTAGGGHSPEVDITVATLPVPVSTRQIVKNGIYSYPNATVQDHAVPTPLNHTIDNTEADSRDEFDIACDVYHLYIVWSSKTNTAIGVTEEIWATVIDMVDGTQVSGFPIKVSTTGSSGMRPTVACDVRNSGGTAKFDVAYIDKSSNAVVLQEFSGTTVVTGHSEILPLQFKNPKAVSPVNISMTGISHARVLVSSVLGVSTPMHAVYAIDVNPLATPVTHDDIVLYKDITWSTATDKARYVDGVQMNNGTGTGAYPAPIITDGTKTQLQNIDDEPITAFANPYDQQDAGSTSANYNQFHCVYRVNYTTKKDGVTNTPINPLFLVRGYDNGTSFPTSSTDTRLLLNRDNTCSSSDPGHSTIEDPTSYCAAVNQMGIHIHWRVSTTSPQKHYYARNIRTFDEEIEENTLATNDCYIADGSGHGGLSTGALIARDGIEMTVWTDPNYGAVNSSTTAGLYLHDPYTTSAAGYYGLLNEGSIIFNANGLELDVTPSSIYGHTHLYTFPVSRFDVASGVTDGGKVNVGPGGLWDFFGAASPSKLVPGVTTLTGSSSGPTYAGLTVHGGAIYPGQSITGSYADVEIFYEQNISPMNTTTTANSNKTGLFEILNDGNSLDYCKVNAYVPPVSSLILDQVVMKILGISTASYPTTSLSSYYTDYTNSGTGAATIQYNVPGYTTAPSFAAFYGGTSSRTDFSINEPINGSSISNMTFDNFFLPIIVNRSASLSSDYGGVTISGNTFEHYSGITVPPGFLICGISVINCNTPTSYKSLWIDNNVFATSNTNLQSAIFLENTTGNVVSNVITASGWRFGIQNIGSTTITPVPKTKAYLCNNIIQNANHDGIVSSFYEGYIKLCRISGCDEGYSSGVTDNPKIIFSSLLSNTNTGLESASNTSFIDLSGLHGSISGSDDAAAFDTIQSNASGLSSSGVGQVSLVNGGYVKYSNDNPVVSWWTQWGRNNTIASSGDPLLISTVSGTAALGLIDNNYWGGDDPSTATGTQPGAMSWDGTNTNSNGISYTANSGGTLFSLQGRPFSVDCGGAFTSNHGTGDDQPTKVQKIADADSCQRLKQWEAGQPQTEEEYQMRYDSLKRYVESCAATDSMSYQAFGFLYGSVSNIHTDDSTRWNSFREWLISVLYLNTTNPHYFCACLTTMIGTYGVEPYRIANAGIAIEKFLIADSNCDDQGLRDQLQFDIDARYNTWLRNGAVPGQLDTIDPSLDTLGLGFLLTRSVNDPLPSVAGLGLGACSSSPNPFTQELAVNFMLNRMTYVTVSIYDPLGRMVWGDGKGRSLDAGTHTIHIDGTGLPSGTLYARISTGFGEVKTVKLVHQE